MASLDGQVALVTGGSSGIGAGIVRALAAAGAKVVVNYHSSQEDAERIVADIRETGGGAVAVGADVSAEEDVLRLFDETVAAFGRLDILVANSGIQKDAPLAEMSLDDWNAVMGVDLTGQFLAVREAVRRFGSQSPSDHSRARGKILMMSSVHQQIPWAGHVNYAAAKGGIMLLMQSTAQEVAGKGIRVNAIAPGLIETEINEEVWSDDDKRAEALTLIPYGRTGKVEDVCRAAVWLCSDDSDYIVGHTLFIDGGMSLYPAFKGNG